MATIIICILWMVLSTLAFSEYADYYRGLTNTQMLAVSLVFIIGGPFFAIANVLTLVLDCILPEGWDDDDDKKWHYISLYFLIIAARGPITEAQSYAASIRKLR